MKTQIFKNAWEYVRTTGVTFSAALIIAWAEAKADKLTNDLIEAQGKAFNYKAEKQIELALSAEVKKINTYKPCHVYYMPKNEFGAYVVNNAGAALCYDGKTFNND